MTNPSEGGSYRREEDGSLTRLNDVTAPAISESETSIEEAQTETSVEDTDVVDSGKKGKA
jgi:hypothetical protein